MKNQTKLSIGSYLLLCSFVLTALELLTEDRDLSLAFDIFGRLSFYAGMIFYITPLLRLYEKAVKDLDLSNSKGEGDILDQ